jgi:hypothetical protein
MEWAIRSERPLYQDERPEAHSADVELPGGRHLDHRLLRMAASAGAACVDERARRR